MRPPAKGNCTVTEEQPRLIGIAELKDAFKGKQTPTQSPDKLKDKLMTVIENGTSDEDYARRFVNATPDQGIAYYTTGFNTSILKMKFLIFDVTDCCTCS